jgi:DNA gyrase subunit A
MLIINTAQIPSKASKENGGIAVMTQKKGQRVTEVSLYEKGNMEGDHRYRARNLPAAGSKKPSGEGAEQTKLEI